MKLKRLFFAFNVLAPWPQELPQGRVIANDSRHLTIAFIGETDSERLLEALEASPPPLLPTGPTGIFNRCLFLPKRHPHVVAWDIKWMDDPAPLVNFQSLFMNWLKDTGFAPREMKNVWLAHVSLARQPFDEMQWKQTFDPLPMFLGNFCLYESLGALTYHPIWTYPITPPFQEIDHTADLAFIIYGESLSQLFQHAQIALAFKFPPLLTYLSFQRVLSLDELVLHLNMLIVVQIATSVVH